MDSILTKVRAFSILAVIAVLVGACSGDGEDSASDDAAEQAQEAEKAQDTDASAASGNGDEEAVPIDVAYIPVSSAAALHLGVQEGFFAEEGLDVTLVDAEPPSMIPSVLSGEIDFAFLNAPAVMVARENGLAVQGVAAASKNAPEPEDHFIQLVVHPDAGIESPQDLVGRTLTVDTLYQLPHLSLLNALNAVGVDPSEVEFNELPYPSMPSAIEEGDAEAVLAGEPFTTLSERAGGKVLLSASEGQSPELAQSVMLASEEYIAENGDIVDRFVRAMDRSMAYAEDNTDAVREVVTTFTAIEPELAQEIGLPGFQPGFAEGSWEQWLDVLVAEDLVSEDFDVEAAYYEP